MRILLSSEHRYPAFGDFGAGPHPKPYPSGSGFWIHDLLGKGLAEMGHEVFYLLRQGAAKPLPPGVRLVSQPVWDADILHTISDRDDPLIREWQSRGRPWVSTCHIDMRTRGMAQRPTTDNWIFVSRTLARMHGRERYVLNGIDPETFIYSEKKQNYFLFMSSMDWEMKKGLDVALSLAARHRLRLIVAGTGNNYKRIMRITALCRELGAEYVGDVRGKRKAELLAGAKAFLFPTRIDEAFEMPQLLREAADRLIEARQTIANLRVTADDLIDRYCSDPHAQASLRCEVDNTCLPPPFSTARTGPVRTSRTKSSWSTVRG
jgi:glycosyltransferase involved in cell wall biosynthesis